MKGNFNLTKLNNIPNVLIKSVTWFQWISLPFTWAVQAIQQMQNKIIKTKLWEMQVICAVFLSSLYQHMLLVIMCLCLLLCVIACVCMYRRVYLCAFWVSAFAPAGQGFNTVTFLSIYTHVLPHSFSVYPPSAKSYFAFFFFSIFSQKCNFGQCRRESFAFEF